jgi:hypothetical protein
MNGSSQFPGNLNWHTFTRFAIDLKLVINVFRQV